ncbi:MAG: biopolymer transporter ExbD [Bacteroidota bacterium]|nr:biopolymer transporter ExbD [Bacteroidota bacterium]
MARKVPEVNAGSMADIAFLLLIFFLVTTTMDVDTGIIRVLPPPLNTDEPPPKVKDRNIMKVLVNSRNRLLINGEPGNINNLKEKVKDFMSIHPDNPEYPETKIESIELIGDVPTTRGIISLKNDRGTSYEMYINVQDQLAAAFHDLRDDLAMDKFGRKYDDLALDDQKKAIEKAIPIRISEAEPEDVGGGN